MLIDYYIDMQDDQGTHWLKAWRCIGCGEVVDPGILRRRMVRESRLPGFVERVSGRRLRGDGSMYWPGLSCGEGQAASGNYVRR